jgi:hypothetical protein
MTNSVSGTSPRRLARITGALYLVNIVAGAFAIGIVPALLFTPDLATTAHNIQTHAFLYRSSLVAHIIVTLTNVPMALLFFDLFKVVNRRIALLDMFFTLVATAIETAGLVNQFTPLVLLGNGTYANSIPAPQLQALVHLPTDLSAINYDIYTMFYGFDIICLAYLVFRSTFLPRAIGVLLAIDGVAYLVHGFVDLLAPAFAAHLSPWIDLPALLGEGSLCVWLLVVGLDAARWHQWGTGPATISHTYVSPLESGA